VLRKPVAVKFVGDVAWENAVNRGETRKLLEDFLEHPDGGWYLKSIKNLQGFVLRSVDRVITPSHYLKKILMTYYNVPENNIRVVYNSVETYPLGKKGAKNGGPALITVGRLVPWKRVDEVIRLVPELVQKYPRLKLMVVGSGPEEERLKMLCQEMKVEKHVVFTGRASREDALELMAGSDLLVLNSVYEGLPHIVLDAMACRTPVVATNISGTSEVLEDGKTGLLVNPCSEEELKDKIVQLLEDDELRSRIIENAYQEVRERFTWERNLGLLEKELASIL
jgi:glycosyltransferase involved in cell wall biosynthesis